MKLEEAIEIQKDLILDGYDYLDYKNFRYECVYSDYVVDNIKFDIRIIVKYSSIFIQCVLKDLYQKIYDTEDEEENDEKLLLGKCYNIPVYYQHENNKNTTAEKVIESLKFIYDLKENYEYSSVLDKLVLKSTKTKTENIHISSLILTHKEIDECCVCYTPNTVLSFCGHNLCRCCYIKISSGDNCSQCPICRRCFHIEHRGYDDDTDYDDMPPLQEPSDDSAMIAQSEIN
jgi:hypothetical protein